MHRDRARAESFGAEAARYDRARPSYPPELAERLLEGGADRVLDVGCGTGIASRLLRDLGCEVLGVEPDPRMAAVARGSGLTVEEARFEEWDPGRRRFDLVMSAQAWHWVDPEAGAQRAFEALVPSGEIAVFWNFGSPEPRLGAELAAVYERLAPECDRYAVLLGARDERVEVAASALARSGRFLEPRVESFPWTRSYSAAEWLENVRTHSDHATMDADRRRRLLDALGAVITERGPMQIAYQTRLLSARLR
jgi:SAM-dependent methyltransferase